MKIETKFKKGQKIWFLYRRFMVGWIVCKGEVFSISIEVEKEIEIDYFMIKSKYSSFVPEQDCFIIKTEAEAECRRRNAK